MSTPSRVTTRDAIPADAPAISTLARQLGYEVSPITAANRLVRLAAPDERVIVAADPDGAVVGWTSARVTEHIHSDPHVEISGFVVEEAARGRGIGRALMSEVERWARSRGLATLRLNANVTRTGAHQFYEKLGFTRTKQQVSFHKELRG
jgi:PhnO protein